MNKNRIKEELDLAAEEIWEHGEEVDEQYITPDILEVKALENYLIKIVFSTKEEKIYDVKPLIEKNEIYHKLKDKNYFKKVKPRGETVEWEQGEDICPEELYYNSKTIY